MITSKNCLEKYNKELEWIKNTQSSMYMAAGWIIVYNWCSENGYTTSDYNGSGIECIIAFLEQLKQKADAAQQQVKD